MSCTPGLPPNFLGNQHRFSFCLIYQLYMALFRACVLQTGLLGALNYVGVAHRSMVSIPLLGSPQFYSCHRVERSKWNYAEPLTHGILKEGLAAAGQAEFLYMNSMTRATKVGPTGRNPAPL